jgi:hypothetical protein
MYISKGFISQRSTVHYVGVISSDSTISTRNCILEGNAASPRGFSLFPGERTSIPQRMSVYRGARTLIL